MAFAGPTLPPAAIANDVWLSRFRTTLVAVLGGTVMGIACLAFYTSFEAKHLLPQLLAAAGRLTKYGA